MSLGGAATEEDGNLIAKLFGSVGKLWKADEIYFDAVSGLSGSGLAYLYLAIEALADGGVAAGLPQDLALGLASQTVLGAASMATKTGKHPGQLKDDVTSPGGTTIAGIHELERGRGIQDQIGRKVVERRGQTTEYLYLKINNDSQELNNYFDKDMIKPYGRKEEELALILFSDGCVTLRFINNCATKSDNGQAALIQQDLFSFEN
ncbi:hypothetical protein TIFTF001_054215 [Ficus carica]|uniref:Pyrroline-5-carboxylate reductase dimerisation domain-containing protein n=1 Tax=Ficus carica TaxID=3494 RepID=A0AA88EK13_FICCA|nr:hypothetical protein TIFTF001_054215 [Ficus carica]